MKIKNSILTCVLLLWSIFITSCGVLNPKYPRIGEIRYYSIGYVNKDPFVKYPIHVTKVLAVRNNYVLYQIGRDTISSKIRYYNQCSRKLRRAWID